MSKRNLIEIAFAISAWMFIAGPANADYLTMTGSELYGQFCASCHGPTARGDGPVAKSLTVPVPDLTLIAARQGGKFPTERVEKTIDGRYVIAAHGTRAMPIWGEGLSRTEIGNPDAERATQTIIAKLVEYVRSVQRPMKATD